jgi:hypothetical protein
MRHGKSARNTHCIEKMGNGITNYEISRGRCLTVTAIFCSQRKMSMRNARMYRFNRMSIYLMAFHQFQDMSVSSHSRNNSLEHFWYPN